MDIEYLHIIMISNDTNFSILGFIRETKLKTEPSKTESSRSMEEIERRVPINRNFLVFSLLHVLLFTERSLDQKISRIQAVQYCQFVNSILFVTLSRVSKIFFSVRNTVTLNWFSRAVFVVIVAFSLLKNPFSRLLCTARLRTTTTNTVTDVTVYYSTVILILGDGRRSRCRLAPTESSCHTP